MTTPAGYGTVSVPVIVLTGFLGAGKTTVLNRVLSAQHRLRVAVIVNELGRIDVDAKLLKERSGDVVELAGGCVCHEARTQEELWSALDEVLARSRPDRIVIETTGIAEPGPLRQGLAVRPGGAPGLPVAGVVTVVDATAGVAALEKYTEARAQVEGADRILLSKLDMVADGDVLRVHRALDVLNRDAERANFPDTGDGTARMVPWLLDVTSAAGVAARTRHTYGSHEHGQLVAASFSSDSAFVAEPLLQVCRDLGAALVRAKGFVHIVGESRRGFLERAGGQLELRFIEAWPPGDRRTELVFIGQDLDEAVLTRRLWACRATC